MTDIDPAALESHDQFVSVWRSLVLAADPGADVGERSGLQMLWADSALLFWRCATLTEVGTHTEELATRLREAAGVMRAKPRAGLLWVFDGLLAPDARDALPAAARDAGLELAFRCVGQTSDRLPVPEPRHPELTFARVTTDEALRAYADLNAWSYGLPLDDVRAGLCGSLPLWTSRIHAYLGLRDGEPVSTAATMACDDRLFVMFVATAPEHRRRGYGEAVTRKALHEGGRATGLTRAVLQATEDGAPVYPRIGFVPNAPVHVYTTA